ncbi:MAG: sulfur carrier protein ThiS [Pseudomonadota bacterium]
MEIELNGAAHQVVEGQKLSELVAALSLSNQAIAVAVNRQIVARSSWSAHRLQAHDKVDVVRAIGGG